MCPMIFVEAIEASQESRMRPLGDVHEAGQMIRSRCTQGTDRIQSVSQTTNSTSFARPAGIRASASYFPELESLRGWAILLVFLFHADGVVTGYERIGTMVSPALAFMTAGHTGVTLFFVLSAFLLSRPFLEEGRGRRRVDLRNFFRRRILRIMPLYATAIVVAVTLSYDDPSALIDGFYALFFMNSFTGTANSLMPYSAVWWSLATEIQFYLVLPMLGLTLRTRMGRWIGLITLIVWAIAYAILATDPSLLSTGVRFRLGLSILGRAPAFLGGIAAAWFVLHYGDRLRSAMHKQAWLRNGGSDLLLLVVLYPLGLLLQKVTARGFILSEIKMPAWHVGESLLWTAVVLLVVLAPLRTRAVVANRFMGILGLLSYSLYLIHEPVLFPVLIRIRGNGVPIAVDLILRGMVFAAVFALCVAISAVTYRVIERPFLLRKAKIE